VSENEWEKKGLVVPAPKYGAIRAVSSRGFTERSRLMSYDSSRCVPLPCEEKLYRSLGEREDALIGEMAALARRPQEKEDANVDVMEDEELANWIKMRLSQPHGLISLDHAAHYSMEAGFRFGVDRIVNLSKTPGGVFKVLYSLSPPGSFYTEPKLTDDASFTFATDWDSPLLLPGFKDDLHCYRDIPFDVKLVVVVDVRLVKRNKKGALTSENYGWSVLPVFRATSGAFVRTGLHQLPLMQGAPNSEILKELNSSDVGIAEFLHNQMTGKAPRLKWHKSGVSAIVRLVDSQLLDCVTIGTGNADTYLLPVGKDELRFKVDLSKPSRNKKTMKSILSKNEVPSEFEKSINTFFSNETEIRNATF